MEESGYYRQLPYRLVIDRDPQCGLFTAMYPELSNCSATGASIAEAIRNAEAKKAAVLSGNEGRKEMDAAEGKKYYVTHEHDDLDRHMKDRHPLRVAAYIREIVPNNGLRSPIDLQRQLYTMIINGHPGWRFAGIYADEGTAEQLKNRPGLQSLLKDCGAGMIDAVICKNCSRLFHSVHDLVAFTDHLADFDPPVGVYFEAERFFSLATDELTD